MSFFRNLSISRKLTVAFGAVIFICVGIGGGVALLGLILLNRSTLELDSKWLPGTTRLAEMRYQYEAIHRAELNYILCPDDACRTLREGTRTRALEKMPDVISGMEALLASSQERDLLATFRRNYEAALLVGNQAIRAAQAGHPAEANDIMRNQKESLFDQAEENLMGLSSLEAQGGAEATAQAAIVYNGVRLAATLAGMLGAALSFFAVRWLTRQIAGPLIQAVAVLKRLAAKDLTATLESDSEDEIGQMSRALNTTVRSMQEMVLEMQQSSGQMAAATQQISAAAAETSSSAYQQSKQVQQVAASAQQMSSSIVEISKNCEQAALASQKSASSAVTGGATVRDAVDGMQKIAVANTAVVEKMELLGKSSAEIGKVVEVIREIANQTNLLALNAAIESARAGEHGRGFAVVASEVRRLSERTQQATEEIDQMVGTIRSNIDQALTATASGRSEVGLGLERTSSAKSTLDEIIQVAKRSEEMVSVIATAAIEQSAVSTEISESMNSISQMIEQTSIFAEESSKACDSLRQLAANLDTVVNRFQLEGRNIAIRSSREKPSSENIRLEASRA